MPKFKNSNATFWVIFKHCDDSAKSDLSQKKSDFVPTLFFIYTGHDDCNNWYLFLEVAIVSLPQILWDSVDPTSLSIGVLTLCPCTRRQLSHWWDNLIYQVKPTTDQYVHSRRSKPIPKLPWSMTISHIVWKLLKISHMNLWILAFSANFWPIKTDFSGNSVWPKPIGFQKLATLNHFLAFLMNFCPLKM